MGRGFEIQKLLGCGIVNIPLPKYFIIKILICAFNYDIKQNQFQKFNIKPAIINSQNAVLYPLNTTLTLIHKLIVLNINYVNQQQFTAFPEDCPGPRLYFFSNFFPPSIVSSVTSFDPSGLTTVVFFVVTVFPFTVFVTVLTDFDRPPFPPVPPYDAEDEKADEPPKPPIFPNPPPKKSSSSNMEEKPKGFFFPFFFPKKPPKKSSSSQLSNPEDEKKCLKRLSASVKLNELNPPILGPSKPQLSQLFLLDSSESTSQAQAIYLNFYFAYSLLLGFLSGCHLIANFLQAFLISSLVAFLLTPSTSQQSLFCCDISWFE